MEKNEQQHKIDKKNEESVTASTTTVEASTAQNEDNSSIPFQDNDIIFSLLIKHSGKKMFSYNKDGKFLPSADYNAIRSAIALWSIFLNQVESSIGNDSPILFELKFNNNSKLAVYCDGLISHSNKDLASIEEDKFWMTFKSYSPFNVGTSISPYNAT